MAKNKVNDNGLENNVPEMIQTWYHCEYQIKRLKKRQKVCSKDIQRELDNARKFGYSEKEIKELIGDVTIPSWYLIVE